MSDYQLLMVQSNADSVANYRRMLHSLDCEIIEATSTEQAIQRIRKQVFPVVVTGLELPSSSGRPGGIEILRELQRLRLPTQTIVITAANTQQEANQILQYGAFSYLQRPVDAEVLIHTVESALKEFEQLSQTIQQSSPVTAEEEVSTEIEPILGNSRLIRHMLTTIKSAAANDNPILLVGENGVGKTLAAAHVHQQSQRKEHRFGRMDCQQLHRLQKRAYIEILAYRNGTLILENIQAVTENTVLILAELMQRIPALNIRVLMTSHYGKEALHDLYHSLGIALEAVLPVGIQTIWIPPLRERKDGDDLKILATDFLNYYSQDQLYPMKFSQDALKYIETMDFTVGNIRELRNLVFAVAQATYEHGERAITSQTIDEYVEQVIRASRPIQTRQIFVSHSSRDKDFVVQLLKDLESEYLDFWIDHERIPFGSPAWFDEINKGLEQSDAMLLIVSPDSMASDEVKSEWDYCLRNKKIILPLIYKPVDNMNYRLPKLQAITYSEDNIERIRNAIINILRNPF